MGLACRFLMLLVFACVSFTSIADQADSDALSAPKADQSVSAESNPPETEKVSSKTLSIDKSSLLVDQKSDRDTINRDLGQTTSWPVVILALLGIIGFIFLLAWGAKRFGGLSAMGIRDMKVVAAMPVGTRERVAIIDVKGQQFLIGITAQNINHLHSFPEPVITNDEKRPGEFAEKLAKLMNAKNNEQKQAADNEV